MVQPVVEFEAFLINKPIVAKPLTVAPLDPDGDAPATVIHIESESFKPLGSNIQHILDEIDQELELDSLVHMDCSKVRVQTTTVEDEERPRVLSLVAEEEATSWASILATVKRAPVVEASHGGSRQDKTSSSWGDSLVKPSSLEWTIGGPLARFGGELRAKPFQALMELIPQESLRGERDLSAQGMAE